MNSSEPHLVRFKLSFGDHGGQSHRGINRRNNYNGTRNTRTRTAARPRTSRFDLEIGHYGVLEGFPCRITRIDKSPTFIHGHFKLIVYGVDLFDHKKKHCDILGPNCTVNIPTTVMVESHNDDDNDDVDDDAIFHRGLPLPLPLPYVCWMNDDTIQPQDNDHFALTTCIYDPSKRVTTTLVWNLDKKTGDLHNEKVYNFFLGERDAFVSRERNRKSFLAFLATMQREESPCSILRPFAVDGVLMNIFGFVCGPQKYRYDPESNQLRSRFWQRLLLRNQNE